MDHLTFAQLLGNYGEFVGAIAVVGTLIYLANQLKQNTRALRSSAYQSYNERTDSYWDFEAQHAAILGPIYEQQKEFDQLTGEQQPVLNASMMKGFDVLEGMFLQYRAGTLGDSEFATKAEGFKATFRSPLVRKAWERLRPTRSFTHEYRVFIETEVFNTPELDDNDPYFSSYKKAD